MDVTFDSKATRELLLRLARAETSAELAPSGPARRRQPVHVVYGGAHRFRADVAHRFGRMALAALQEYAPSAGVFGAAIGLPAALADTIYERVVQKLVQEPVEDYRIDFEDGYGPRSDAEEDGHAVAAAREVAGGLKAKSLPPALGIRIKPLTEISGARALRTLDLFLTTLAHDTGGTLPDGFVVTLPKVTWPEQPATLAEALSRLEAALKLGEGAISVELMIETPRAIVDERGVMALRGIVQAGAGRVVGAHLGPYDYAASLGLVSAEQAFTHPSTDLARLLMQLSLGESGIHLSDGPTNLIPVPPHRPREGETLTPAQVAENHRAMFSAWKLHHDNVRRVLNLGFYQGWDLHPAQLPTRYAAVYGFFLERLPAIRKRYDAFLATSRQGSMVGNTFDDAATGRALERFLALAKACGAEGDAVNFIPKADIKP